MLLKKTGHSQVNSELRLRIQSQYGLLFRLLSAISGQFYGSRRVYPKRGVSCFAGCQVKNYTNFSGYMMSQPPEKKTAMSALDQLKRHTIVVADSGDIKGKRTFHRGQASVK